MSKRSCRKMLLTDGLGACWQRADLDNNMRMSRTTLLQPRNPFKAMTGFCELAMSPCLNLLKLLDAVVSAVAGLVAGHRTTHKSYIHRMDVEYKRLLPAVVGPLAHFVG